MKERSKDRVMVAMTNNGTKRLVAMSQSVPHFSTVCNGSTRYKEADFVRV